MNHQSVSFSNPLTPTLSLREKGLSGTAVIIYIIRFRRCTVS